MFKISDWFKLILCTVLSSGVATAGNFGQMNFAYWQTIVVVPTVSGSYLVVAGGGSGGVLAGAGGGAGGLLTSTASFALGTTYTVTVGSGGAAATDTPGTGVAGNNGSDSIISGTGLTTIDAVGGGGGAAYPSYAALAGGSGGGGTYNSLSGAAGTSGQGNAGGNGTTNISGAGGGGAGAAGSTTTSTNGANGGIGVTNSITGSSVYYAGGGGGSGQNGSSGGSGGSGGGGNGDAGNKNFASSGSANTGVGGGGARDGNGIGGFKSGAGGSGVVIISLPNTYLVNAQGTVTSSANGSNTVYKWTGSGSFVIYTSTAIAYSYYFDFSSSSNLTTPSTTVLDLSYSTSFTLECWLYWTYNGTNTNSIILDKDGHDSGTYSQYLLQINGGDTLLFEVGSGNGTSSQQVISTTSFPQSTWFHVAGVNNAGTLTLYVNGVAKATATKTATMVNGSKTLVIGGNPSGGTNENLNGYISNLRIVKGTAVYTTNFIPPPLNLTAISGTSLLTAQSSTIVDNSGNSLPLTNNNSVTSSTTHP